MAHKSNTAVVTIGIDPGKNTLHLVGLDARGRIVLREKVAHTKIVYRLANVPHRQYMNSSRHYAEAVASARARLELSPEREADD